MAQYEVTYSLGSRTDTSSFTGTSGLQYQKIVVEANGPTTAQRIVENMFGGPNNCLVGSAWQVG
jgi:hypothetical protein